MTRTLALLTSIALAGSAAAQTIDTSGMHAAPLPSSASPLPAQAQGMHRALATSMTRAVAHRDADGQLTATCEVEANPAGVAAERAKRSQSAHKE